MAERREGELVTVNGVGYTTDPQMVTWATIEVGRQGVDQGAGPGEAALSNEIVWRRHRDDWIEGAGQANADLLDDESSRLRFRSSVSIDPWERRELRLHKKATLKTPSAFVNEMVVATTSADVPWVFWRDGTAKVTASKDLDVASPTLHDITGPANVHGVTTDGSRIWILSTASVWYIDVATVDSGTYAATALGSVGTAGGVIGYANGRLLRSATNNLYEVSSTGVSTLVFAHPNTSFAWKGIAPSPAGIYCFGRVGDNSEVFVVTAIDGTGALDVPFSACSLPDGERLYVMTFYLGVMVMGTSKGLRLAVITGGGFLSFGPVVDEPGAVQCLEPQGDDVWFGWADVTAGRSGLGRARLSRFTSELVPAFASDLLGNVSSSVTAVVTFKGKRYFGLFGPGVFGEHATDYEPTGTIDLGWFTYGIPEPKLIDGVQLWTDALPVSTSVDVDVYADDQTVTKVVDVTYNTTGNRTRNFAATLPVEAERYRPTLTLTTNAPTTTPVVKRLTLRSAPKPFISQRVRFPVILRDDVASDVGTDYGMDVLTEWLALNTLVLSRERVVVAFGQHSLDMRLEGLEVQPVGQGQGVDEWDDRKQFLAGKWMVTAVTLQPDT